MIIHWLFAARPFFYCVYISNNTLDYTDTIEKRPRGKQPLYNHVILFLFITKQK